ncbi:hypothetical protein [Spirosoma montaniterrae]|nr:hypothetical protein [Spirosoma montaniterrae]
MTAEELLLAKLVHGKPNERINDNRHIMDKLARLLDIKGKEQKSG